MADFLIIAVVAVIIGATSRYIYQSKKRGVKCIGCPEGGSCNCCCSGGKSACGCGCGGNAEAK